MAGDRVLEVKGVLLHARDVEIVGLRPNGVNQDVVGHLKDIFVINLPLKTHGHRRLLARSM